MVGFSLVLAFGLELAGLVAFGLWGYRFGSSPALKILLALSAPLLVAVFWGTFLSPRAAIVLPANFKAPLRLTVFALATVAFLASNHPVSAAIFAGLVVLNATVLGILRIDGTDLLAKGSGAQS